jgi:hypothetical protein
VTTLVVDCDYKRGHFFVAAATQLVCIDENDVTTINATAKITFCSLICQVQYGGNHSLVNDVSVKSWMSYHGINCIHIDSYPKAS